MSGTSRPELAALPEGPQGAIKHIAAADHRVTGITPGTDDLTVVTSRGGLHATAVVLATGGQSLPKSGSDGAGFAIARGLGHTIVPTTPALVPLLLTGDRWHRELSGVSQTAELAIRVDGLVAVRPPARCSGPTSASAGRSRSTPRVWLRATLENATSL